MKLIMVMLKGSGEIGSDDDVWFEVRGRWRKMLRLLRLKGVED